MLDELVEATRPSTYWHDSESLQAVFCGYYPGFRDDYGPRSQYGQYENLLGPRMEGPCDQESQSQRKLPYTLEMIHNTKSWIGVNTSRTNKLAAAAIDDGTIGELQHFDNMRKEVKTGASRIDLLLERNASQKRSNVLLR